MSSAESAACFSSIVGICVLIWSGADGDDCDGDDGDDNDGNVDDVDDAGDGDGDGDGTESTWSSRLATSMSMSKHQQT